MNPSIFIIYKTYKSTKHLESDYSTYPLILKVAPFVEVPATMSPFLSTANNPGTQEK